MKRRIVVTSALPYANGPLHFGHLLEAIQTDIWVRWKKLNGNECYYICADDAHGTPIMLAAEKENKTPEAYVADIRASRLADFGEFHVDFDNYHTTHSEENQHVVELIFDALQKKGDIVTKDIEQLFDPKKQLFLPDRFVKGECPKCGAADQYGDSCEACSATYSPTELKNPRSALSDATPELKSSKHYFFTLPNYETFLRTWMKQDTVPTPIANKLNEWFSSGLMPWDISRDAPYFGIRIPGETNKYFYVWLDAPAGYLASFLHFCKNHPELELTLDTLTHPNSTIELCHFIGKDITYFHALFWPALLHGAGLRTPNKIYVHGFLTINGQKMSKSRGTFITARQYLEHLNPEYLRYYFASKLNASIEDIDFNFDDFRQRVNADLIGKFVNIASRAAGFIEKHFDGFLSDADANSELTQTIASAFQDIDALYDAREYGQAMRAVMQLADRINQFFDAEKPWANIKQETQRSHVHAVCSTVLSCFRMLAFYLKPVLPITVAHIETFFKIAPLTAENYQASLAKHAINAYQPLLTRVDLTMTDAIQPTQTNTTDMPVEKKSATPVDQIEKPLISIDDFSKIDLRIARIIHAEEVPEAEKLLRLTVEVGGKERQLFAGIKGHVDPQKLIGQLTVIVANLAPRKMRFGISEGMLIVASDANTGLFLLHPEDGATSGMQVK